MADDVQVTFGANITALIGSLNTVKDKFAELAAHGTKVASSFGGIATAATFIGAGLATWGLDSWVRNLADAGVEAEKLSAALGITGHQFSDLKAAAALSGVGIESLALSIERMSLQIQRSTRDAFTPQAEALKVLHLSSKDLIGLSADQYFLKIADAASKFAPSLNLTNALMAIGGRSMANMVAAYTMGTDAIRKFQEEMQKTKIGQEGFYKAAQDTHHQLLLMDSAVEGLNKQMFMGLKPTLDIIINNTREFMIAIRESIKEGGAWYYVLESVNFTLKALITTIIKTSYYFEIFMSLMNAGFTLMKEGSKAATDQLTADAERISATMKAKMAKLWDPPVEPTASFRDRWDAMGKVQAEAMDQMGRKRLEMSLKAIDAEIALVESGFERKQLIYDRDVLSLQKTELQKIQAVSAASQQRYAEEVALLQKKLALGGLDMAQRQDIENKITEIQQKAINDRIRMQNDSIRETQAQWGNFLNTIQSSFTGQLRGLLQGTTTWKNAMKSIFTDIVVWAISEFTKLAIIKPLIASLSEAFAPTEIFANILKMIMKMIGQVFAGVTAFFAPTLGPAAPAAGAAVAGATEAAALSYDTGAWSVPQTAHALVHRDEMILPVDFASAVRSAMTGGAFGGSSNLTLSIQAWDGASVARWLRTGGADVLARAISAQYNQNPTIRPRY